MGEPIIEFDYLITPDGLEYQFNTNGNSFLTSELSPLGMPRQDVQTQRSPYQHGETALNYSLNPRVVTMVHRKQACSRQAFWAARQDLENHIRPNRQLVWGAYEPCQLVKVLPDNTRWVLDVYFTGGAEFRARREWDEWSAEDAIRFTAYDPTFRAYDVTEVELDLIVAGSELCFPICFPICFQAEDTIDDSEVVSYMGTWQSFPVIELDGPIENPIITNEDTGEKIEMSYAIPAGITVTIDCRAARKTVVDSDNTNLIGTLTEDSDLGTFHLAPDPESPNGQNTISIFGIDAAAGLTEMRLSYYCRMIAI